MDRNEVSAFLKNKEPGMYQHKGFMLIKTQYKKQNIMSIGSDGIEEICNGDTSLPGVTNSQRDEHLIEFFKDTTNRGIHRKAYESFMKPSRAKEWFKEQHFVSENQTKVVDKEAGITLITKIGNLVIPYTEALEERDADFAGIPIKRLRRYSHSNKGRIRDKLTSLYEDLSTTSIKKIDKRTYKAAGLALAGVLAITTSYKLSFPSNQISKEATIESINQEVARHYAGQLIQGNKEQKMKITLDIKKNPNISIEDVKKQIDWINEQRSK